MWTRPSSRKRAAKAAALAALTASLCAMAMSAPTLAHGSNADCTAAKKAATLQSTTPFHATYTVTPTTAGAFPTEHHEEIWVGNTMYTLWGDGRWLRAVVPDNPMGGFTGPIDGFSQCRSLPAVSIRGEMAPGYDLRMESGRRATIYISPKTGLPARDLVDQDILLVTLDFDYANVKAPR